MIIEQTLNLLKTKYLDRIEDLTIADTRIGISMTAVRLSDNSYGTSSTFINTHQHCEKTRRNYGDFSPLNIKGQKVVDLFELQKDSGIMTTLKIA